MSVKMNGRHLAKFVADDEFDAIFPQVSLAHETLHGKTGPGSDFLGWVDLPVDYDKEEFARIKKAAAKIQSDSDVLVVIGIGGSYLGARAAIEALKGTLYNNTCKGTPQIFYVGNSISPAYLQSVLDACEGKDISVNVISKSGTTTEPALAFRIFKALLEKKYGKDGAKGRIYATTDKARGTLKELSADEGYETFVVPDDVGGRYSVLTAVGLLPIAAAGCDIDALMAGAAKAREELAVCSTQNECYRYAVVDIKQPQRDLYIEKSADNFDGLDFLAGQDMSVVNRKAMEGTILAHTDGGVPNIILEVDSLTEADLGYLIYFFEKACAISGYMLGVNPFNQPGVESYKKNMFALLGKPGYEAQKAELEAKLR